jgi:hypothetical protein
LTTALNNGDNSVNVTNNDNTVTAVAANDVHIHRGVVAGAAAATTKAINPVDAVDACTCATAT